MIATKYCVYICIPNIKYDIERKHLCSICCFPKGGMKKDCICLSLKEQLPNLNRNIQ